MVKNIIAQSNFYYLLAKYIKKDEIDSWVSKDPGLFENKENEIPFTDFRLILEYI